MPLSLKRRIAGALRKNATHRAPEEPLVKPSHTNFVDLPVGLLLLIGSEVRVLSFPFKFAEPGSILIVTLFCSGIA
jgi:hypothetical protein